MKRTILSIATGVLAMAVTLPAQTRNASGPRAYGDKNNDGICDYTGRKVGQGYGGGMGGGMGAGMRRGRMAAGQGRGYRGRCPRMAQTQTPAQTTPAAPDATKK